MRGIVEYNMHDCEDLIRIFNQCFATKYKTKLVKGKEEPLYLPAAREHSYHAIFFAHGFFSSALHECAHWFIAGKERREQIDYGYWYEPDGRSIEQQYLFQEVEARPQALEWILSSAASYRFQISIDNLKGPTLNVEEFKHRIHEQVLGYCAAGLPKRAQLFHRALCEKYGNSPVLSREKFQLLDL
jgi:elongation factor P hydroxylase